MQAETYSKNLFRRRLNSIIQKAQQLASDSDVQIFVMIYKDGEYYSFHSGGRDWDLNRDAVVRALPSCDRHNELTSHVKDRSTPDPCSAPQPCRVNELANDAETVNQ